MARARAEQMRGNQYAKGHAPNGTSFTAGLVPWNKGTRGVMQPNSGSFRDGEPSPKLVPDGSMRVRVDKQGKARNWIKVAGFWIPNARHVWEQHNGPLPSGKVIHHIDETGLNDAPENLTPLTREDHIRLHRPIAV